MKCTLFNPKIQFWGYLSNEPVPLHTILQYGMPYTLISMHEMHSIQPKIQFWGCLSNEPVRLHAIMQYGMPYNLISMHEMHFIQSQNTILGMSFQLTGAPACNLAVWYALYFNFHA